MKIQYRWDQNSRSEFYHYTIYIRVWTYCYQYGWYCVIKSLLPVSLLQFLSCPFSSNYCLNNQAIIAQANSSQPWFLHTGPAAPCSRTLSSLCQCCCTLKRSAWSQLQHTIRVLVLQDSDNISLGKHLNVIRCIPTFSRLLLPPPLHLDHLLSFLHHVLDPIDSNLVKNIVLVKSIL